MISSLSTFSYELQIKHWFKRNNLKLHNMKFNCSILFFIFFFYFLTNKYQLIFLKGTPPNKKHILYKNKHINKIVNRCTYIVCITHHLLGFAAWFAIFNEPVISWCGLHLLNCLLLILLSGANTDNKFK